MIQRILAFCFAWSITLIAFGQDSLRISWLTCGAGTESYSLYGHTAIRVQNRQTGEDIVYNYGMFNFDAPHFLWRFVLGQTDYYLGTQSFDSFVQIYAYYNRWVDEQELLLQPLEKMKLAHFLYQLSQQEDWTYRYNFLKDNCTTRALETVQMALEHSLIFPKEHGKTTYRSMLHQFTKVSPWNEFGNDLLIGQDVDKPISVHEQFFLPLCAEYYLPQTKVRRADGTFLPLATAPIRLVQSSETSHQANQTSFPSPLAVVIIGVIGIISISLSDYHRKHYSFWLDIPLLFIQGLAGCCVTFLFFFSEHPAVGSNWNILWLNPLPLLFIFGLMRRKMQRWRVLIYGCNIGCYLLLIGISFLGIQVISLEILLLASLLPIRNGTYLLLCFQRHLQ